MEKDYFKDRTKESTSYQAVKIGSYVFICTKDKQRTAKTIHDLRLVKVTAHLTKQAIHPRGQKSREWMPQRGKPLWAGLCISQKTEIVSSQQMGT